MSYRAHFEIRKNSFHQDILFVHGNMASKHWWYPVLEELENTDLKNSGHAIAMAEIRGHGRSPVPANGDVRIDDIVQDFYQVACEAELKNALIVGHSAGGLISSLLLARYPELFKGALLVDPVGPLGLTKVPEDIEEKYAMMAVNPELTSQIVSATIYKNDPENPFFKNQIMNDCMQTLQNSGVKLVKALMHLNFTDEIKTVDQPVQIYYGAHDWVLEEGPNARALAELMKNAELVRLPENGHCFNYENPKQLAKDISSFILKCL